MWEAINTNIQIFTNLRPRLARVSQWLGRCLARTFFGAFEAPGVTRATAMTTTMATARGRRDRPQIPKPTYFKFGFGQLPPDPLRESWHLPATGNSVNRAQPNVTKSLVLVCEGPSMLGEELRKKINSGFSDDTPFPTLKGAAHTITQGPDLQVVR